MIERRVAGDVPPKHHIAFRGADGSLSHEECFTRDGFEGAYTILYHLHRPHVHEPVQVDHGYDMPEPSIDEDQLQLAKRHYRSQDLDGASGPACASTPLPSSAPRRSSSRAGSAVTATSARSRRASEASRAMF